MFIKFSIHGTLKVLDIFVTPFITLSWLVLLSDEIKQIIKMVHRSKAYNKNHWTNKINMTRWCSICDKRGHITSECWYKPNYIKEISREDGKLKKKYTLPSLQKSGKTTPKSRHDKDERSRNRSSSPHTRQRQSVKPKENHTKPTKFSLKRPTNPVGEIE